VAAAIGRCLAGPTRPLTAGSVAELIQRQALARPDHTAVRGPGRDLTFRQLWSGASAGAGTLAECGVRPGDLVALWADRTPEAIVAALAVMLAGAACVPLEPTHPPGRTRAVLAAARPALLLLDRRSPVAPPADLGVTELDLGSVSADSRPSERPSEGPRALPRGGDLAYVVFTSGSTGVPKGVLVEHRSLLNYATWCAATIGSAGTGSPLIGSLGFDLSLTSLWPSLIRGESVVVCGGAWDHEAIFGQSAPFSYVKLTPSMVRFFERTKSPDYGRLAALLIIGGEVLDTSLVRDISGRLGGTRLMNHYGPTETTIGCCAHEFGRGGIPALPSVPIGRPIWNTRLYVVDQELGRVADGQPGELIVAGLGVARGYLHGDPNGAFLDEADVGGPTGRAYRTGDQVEVLPDGTLLCLGRKDDQVKVSGHRVELGELRRLALSMEAVADAAFHVVRGDNEMVEAFVVPRDAVVPDGLAAWVRKTLATMLPSAVVPARVHVVSEIAMNSNGKFDALATRDRAIAAP
jgi:D-alanine--poly(phosphoribitol) ligase subunit 1